MSYFCHAYVPWCLKINCHDFHMLLISVGEVRSGPVPGHFCQTGDWTVQSQMKYLGLGPGPPGTVYPGLVPVQTGSRLGPAKICTILLCRIHGRMERAGVQIRSAWVGVKGRRHVRTIWGGLWWVGRGARRGVALVWVWN